MEKRGDKLLYVLALAIAILSIAVAATGVFYTTGGRTFQVTNQYGDIVKMYGDGIYAHDSLFKAPILRGTDFALLFIGVPALIIAALLDFAKSTLRRRIFLMSMISVFVYYSASIVFGVSYNALALLYIALFSVSLFSLIVAVRGIDLKRVESGIVRPLPYKGIYIFLVFTGVALIIAWLPDILSALFANRPLAMIEVYNTEITYPLDMGVVAPSALICLYLVHKRNGLGYLILALLLTLCTFVGVMLPLQTLFQMAAGIIIPLPALITKMGIFCLLALFALYFNIRLIRAVERQ